MEPSSWKFLEIETEVSNRRSFRKVRRALPVKVKTRSKTPYN
ncbi:hypothetical protein LEP1GSC068_3205 [Leptospira sp. Fiocruz LV3954]|nr:hypothetical protein LEP1GSC068_3205 [Leptospira sp. Fiocruz LV3954]